MNRFYIVLLISVIATFSSCDDIFETNLEKKDLSLILPSDSITTTTYSTSFMWNEVEGATRYKIQIVSPNFSNIQNFILDSATTSTNFSFTLSPGTYQWRVRAENGSSQTDYQTRTILVKSGPLSQQKVNLSSPANAAVFKTSSITFSWQAIYGTTNYILEIDTADGDFTGSKKITKLTANTLSSIVLEEGNYKWRVKASNDTASSQYSDERTLIVDKTAPSVVSTLNYPQSVVISRPIVLTWEPANDNLSGVKKYKVYLYKTVSVSDPNKVLLPNYDPLVVDVSSTGIPTANFTYTAGNVKIFWRIKTVDAAGNESNYSDYADFTTSSAL